MTWEHCGNDMCMICNDMKEDKLDAIFRMQRLFTDEIEKSLRFPQHPIEQINFLCTALSHEVHELQDHTNWKWWKKPKEFNEAEAKEELIDIFHFVIHAALVLNMTADDFLKVYEHKMEINKQRQREGY